MITNSKAIRLSGLVYLIGALLWAAVAEAHSVYLNFDSLPSNQGWTYLSEQLAEGEVFVADGTSLVQTTVGAGNAADARYQMDGIVNSGRDMTLAFTARVLAYERLADGSTGLGFNFLIRDEAGDYRLALTDSVVIVNDLIFDLDTTVLHDYLLELRPGVGFDLYVDDEFVFSGGSSSNFGDNIFFFGDSTAHENTNVEITALSFFWLARDAADIDVQKTVNNAFPAANEPVEFTVQVDNIGGSVAADVLIIDQLPPEMIIPAGTAAFASVGNYDPATGEWLVGEMAIGGSAVLTVPAVVTDTQTPACIVNTARSSFADLLNDSNDQSRAVIHQAGIERCVDLAAVQSIGVGFFVFPDCDSQRRYEGTVKVYNAGPDAARNVTVTLRQTPVIGTGIRFNDNVCQQFGTSVCTVATIASGETLSLAVTSDFFRNATSTSQRIDVAVETTDPDYDPGNDLVAVTRSVPGFSSCLKIDFGLDGLAIGPGCFIATAAYGTSMHPHLDRLREFRDRFMLTNRPGRALVHLYYRYSPPMADYIAERDWLRAIVRGLLAPIVYTIIYPGAAMLLLFGLATMAVVRRRKRTLAE
jgi:uncharacterized repeat protein (TIGR01451 family)